MITVYMDESNRPASEYVGYGALFTGENCNVNEIIAEALYNIKSIPKSNKKDIEISSRGYFHACKDSPKGHSVICNAINKLKNACFICHFENKNDAGTSVKNLYDATAFYSMSKSQRITQQINLIIEERSDITENSFKNKFLKSYEDLLYIAYNQPYLPLTFPFFNFKLGKKSEAGIQCCDFLLWAFGREIDGDKRWSDRIMGSCKIKSNLENKFIRYECSFGDKSIFEKHFYSVHDYDNGFEETVSEDDLIRFFVQAQDYIESYQSLNRSLPAHVMHLQDDIDNFCKCKDKMHVRERIKKTAHLYLKLFDTIPIIEKDTTRLEKTKLLYIKKIMGLILMEKYNQSTRVVDFLSQTLG